jgi:hypothetical protein
MIDSPWTEREAGKTASGFSIKMKRRRERFAV